MDRLLKIFLNFLRKLRFTRGFIHHFFKRWALLLAFLGRRLGVWDPCNDGKGGTVTLRKFERADRSFRGTRTRSDLREWVAAASSIPASASARKPRLQLHHVSNATRQAQQPHPASLTTPAHLTAEPHPDYAYPSRSPSPRDQLLPSSHPHIPSSPSSNLGHRRRQSSNVVVGIESPSTESLTLSPSTSPLPLTEEPYAIGSSTAHSSPISDAPHLRDGSLQPSTRTAFTQPNSDLPSGFSVKPMNPDQVPRYTRKITVQVDNIITPIKPILTFVVRPRERTDYEIRPLTTTFHPEQGSEEDCAPWVSATHPDGALYFYDPARVRALVPL